MKSITMTYIEVLEKRLERKKLELQTMDEIVATGVASNSIKTRFIELKAEIRELENCLDLATVMFEDNRNDDKLE